MTEPYTTADRATPTSDERALPGIARASIAHGLSHDVPLEPNMSQFGGTLARSGASFVTLKLNDELRGCVGSAEPHQPLVRDVARNAHGAAFGDTRFAPLTAVELDHISLSVSILGPLSPIEAANEAELIENLVPGEDGLVLSDQGRRGLFLPQVWDMLRDPEDFVAHLKLKAGFARSYWSPTMVAQRFHVHTYRE
jgi:hypothetical protein